jgi:hypothetical protein
MHLHFQFCKLLQTSSTQLWNPIVLHSNYEFTSIMDDLDVPVVLHAVLSCVALAACMHTRTLATLTLNNSGFVAAAAAAAVRLQLGALSGWSQQKLTEMAAAADAAAGKQDDNNPPS